MSGRCSISKHSKHNLSSRLTADPSQQLCRLNTRQRRSALVSRSFHKARISHPRPTGITHPGDFTRTSKHGVVCKALDTSSYETKRSDFALELTACSSRLWNLFVVCRKDIDGQIAWLAIPVCVLPGCPLKTVHHCCKTIFWCVLADYSNPSCRSGCIPGGHSFHWSLR